MIQFIIFMAAFDPATWNEVAWSKHIAAEMGGIAEYVCADGSRCDVLTDTHAVEIEWATKWKESIGQAVLYGVLTNRKPAVILLVRNKRDERRFILRCALVCSKVGIRFEIRKVP